jgi:cytochrome c
MDGAGSMFRLLAHRRRPGSLLGAFLTAGGFAACGALALAQDGDRSAPIRAGEEARGQRPGNLVGHGGPIKAIRVDPASGRALTGSFDYAMMVWDVAREEPSRIFRFEDHDGPVNAVAFVPGAKSTLSADNEGTVALWDLETGRLVRKFTGHEAKVVGLAVSGDGRWAVSASWDRTARVWDLVELKSGPVLEGHQGPVNAAALSADGARVYTASQDGSIAVHDRADGRRERPIYRHGWGINVLERLPGSERLVFGALDGAAGIVDGETGNVVLQLKAHQRPVLALAVHARSGLLATGGADGIVRVVRASDGALIAEHRDPFGPIWVLAFKSDGNGLYYGGLDDFATLLPVAPRAPLEPVESKFPRRFQVAGNPDDALAQGELQFARKCSVCHALTPDGANRAGPTLHNLFGRKAGGVPGYPYSDALKTREIVWTEEMVARLFELGPEHVTPGSKMPLQKITDAQQRDALIAYLKVATAAPVDENAGSGQGSNAKGGSR